MDTSLSLMQPIVTSVAGAYASGDAVGTKITFDNAPRSGVIHAISVTDLDKQSLALDIIFFRKNPAATTFTDNTALDVADADLLYIIGHVALVAGDYAALVDSSFATKYALGLPFRLEGPREGLALYACAVTRGTPTYATASALQLTVHILQDE